MASVWVQDRISTGGVSSGSARLSAAVAAATENGSMPIVLDQNSRLLLSPAPASMAQLTKAAGSSSLPTTSPEAITLYPVDPVPSHLLCAICTLPYENPVHFLPCCHVFCLECIQLWIGMNFGDDMLQNELRRAYPAEGEVFPELEMGAFFGHDDISERSYLSQQPQSMFEMTRMGDSQPRSGTALNNTVHDRFLRSSSALQQLSQQRVAALLEARDMPKCPMCRSGLHINGWDRIEEQIKVPVSVSQRPRASGNTTGPSRVSSSTNWLEQGNATQGQRPVSGVQRRPARSNRFGPNGASRRREEAIGEEEEEQEAIEMEHVRNPRNLGHQNQPTVLTDRRLMQQSTLAQNGQLEPQSPLATIIGRRPSEWMRHQQRQLQANQERQQANRLRANTVGGASDEANVPLVPDETLHPSGVGNAHDEHQEQIRRLYLEQASQEEHLRNLTARAASFIEAAEQSRRHELDSALATSDQDSRDVGDNSFLAQQDSVLDQPDDNNERDQRTQQRQAALQIDTSDLRAGSHHNRSSQSILIEAEAVVNESSEMVDREQGHSHLPESLSSDTESTPNDSDDNNSIIDALQEGTRAWAQRPTSLRLDLDENQRPLVLSLDGEGQLSASGSFYSSTMTPPGSHPPSLPLSPSNESTLSYVTSSTFSRSAHGHAPFSASISRRSSSQPHWERHSLALQMPTLDPNQYSFDDSEHDHEDYAEQPWLDHKMEPDQETYCKNEDRCQYGELSSSKSDAETTGNEVHGDSTPSCSSISGNKSSPVVGQDLVTASAEEVVDIPLLESSTDTIQGSSSGADIRTNSHLCTSSNGKPLDGPSTTSPLLQDLNTHSQIVPVEGSVATITDIQIDADILARARSHSLALSDDDLPLSARIRLDSPLPTPSIARPRRRFPAGISLAGDDDEDEDEDEDTVEEEHRLEPEHDDHPGNTRRTLPSAELATQEHQSTDNQNEVISSEPLQEAATADIVPESGAPASDHQTTSSLVPETPVASSPIHEGTSSIIQDPLSVVVVASESTPIPSDVDLAEQEQGQDQTQAQNQNQDQDQDQDQSQDQDQNQNQDQEHIQSQMSTPLVRPQRAAMSSPPPLLSPLPAPLEQDPISVLGPAVVVGVLADRDTPGDSGYGTSSGDDIRSDRIQNIDPPVLPVPFSAPLSLDTSSTSLSLHHHEEEEPPARPREHVQYRTLVRYQPRLPKAHVMSELISQIRVECPHKSLGCQETMEMQKALQHGRDKCQFRLVMCPRPRCGQWLRADQIVDHIIMVDSSGTAGSSSNSSASSPSSSGPPSRSSASSLRSLGRSIPGLSHRQGYNARCLNRSLRNQRSQSGNGDNNSPKKQPLHHGNHQPPQQQETRIDLGSQVQPCPGLSWEREQLARATGIIGQLTEENTSLRQMIRQLTLQNSKLLKDQDRWRRYTNINPRRD
ncbi:MAG: hypothetical protein J3Q66DRAFT_101279 [Benniella sp.]|nr:MAG: hypothetical protein J3Q66DRAFT_101279 [Benniella sp.]